MKYTDFTEFPIDRVAGLYNSMSDKRFYTQAFADYSDRQAEITAAWINTVAEEVDYYSDAEWLDDIDVDDDEAWYHAKIPIYMNLYEKGITETQYMQTQYGYISMADFVVECVRQQLSDNPEITCMVEDQEVPTHDLVASYLGDLSSLRVYAAGLRASAETAIADKLAKFDALLSSVESQTASLNSTTYLKIKSLITDGTSPEAIMDNMLNTTGAVEVANDDDLNFGYRYAASDAVKFNGASPVGPLGLHAPDLGIVGKVANVGCKLLKSAVGAVKTLAENVVSNVMTKVEQVAVNPIDLKVMNPLGDHTIYGASIYDDSVPAFTVRIPTPADQDWSTLEDLDKPAILNLIPKTFITDFVFGRLACSGTIANFDILSPETVNGHHCQVIRIEPAVGYRFDARLKVLNPGAVRRIVPEGASSPTPDFINGGGWVKPLQLLSEADDVYQVDTSSENFMMEGLNESSQMMEYMGFFLANQDGWLNNQDYNFDWHRYSDVTNSDFFSEAFVDIHATSNIRKRRAVYGVLLVHLLRAIDEFYRPLDFSFVAYRTNSTVNAMPTYRIATDQENATVFDAALASIITVAAYVAAKITIGFAGKAIAKKRAFKRQATINRLNGKMTRGEPLTKKEKKQYYKATKKGGVASLFDQSSGPGISPEPAPTTDPVINTDINGVITVITGKS